MYSVPKVRDILTALIWEEKQCLRLLICINKKHVTTSVMKRTVLSWANTHGVVVIPCHLFGTAYRSLLQGSRIQEGKDLPLHTVIVQKSVVLV